MLYLRERTKRSEAETVSSSWQELRHHDAMSTRPTTTPTAASLDRGEAPSFSAARNRQRAIEQVAEQLKWSSSGFL